MSYFRALNNEPAENTKRRKQVIKDEVLHLYKKLLKDKDISLSVYVIKVQGLFDIFAKQTKDVVDVQEESTDSGSDSDDSRSGES